MLPERLQSRIRIQLSLDAPDLEARAVATEMAELGKRASERLAQCASLARLGNEQAALQAAEAEPSLLDLCAWLNFNESTRWRHLCTEHGLPIAPPLDDAQLLTVEQLYGKPIDENHPLYRDYRQAIRERDDSRALYVLRSITTVNPGDTNAQAEFNRLSSKFIRDSLEGLTELFAQKKTESAVKLMTRMEQIGITQLANNPAWQNALNLRAIWLEAQNRSRLSEHTQRANRAFALKDWQTCADEVGAVRTIERNTGIKANGEEADILKTCESWATELVQSAAADISARNQAEALREEWLRLSQEAQSGHSADLLRRINKWIDKAANATIPMPSEMMASADALSRALHRKVVRSHTKQVSLSVLVLFVALASAYFIYESARNKTALETALNTINVPLQEWDFEGTNKSIARALEQAQTPELQTLATERIAEIRQKVIELKAEEQRLASEAAYLAEVRSQGVNVTNFSEVERRANDFNSALTQVGSQAAQRLRTQSGDVASLINQSKNVENDLLKQLDRLSDTLEKAIGTDSELAEDTTAKIEALLKIPGTVKVLSVDKSDRIKSLTERSKESLKIEHAAQNATLRLSETPDLKSYLATLGKIQKETPGLDVGEAALFVLEHADELKQLPKNILGPRTASMWEAAITDEPAEYKLDPEELSVAQKISQDNLIRGIRVFAIREHTSPEAGVNLSKIVESEYVVGNLTSQTRRVDGLSETIYKGNVLRSSGDLVEMTWSLREFSNNTITGKEPTEGIPMAEQEYLKRFDRYFTISREGVIPESPLRSLERVRKETGSPILRAYHLQELFRLAAVRPAVSGFIFSPSAQRDAAELRGITQNNLHSWEFVFSRDKALLKELSKFHALTSVNYYAEAKFVRSLLSTLKKGGLVLVGNASLDGKKALCKQVPAAGSIVFGLNRDGKAAALYESIDGKSLRPLANTQAAPFTPLLCHAISPQEAAESAGKPPAELKAPTGGWNSLLKGKDF